MHQAEVVGGSSRLSSQAIALQVFSRPESPSIQQLEGKMVRSGAALEF